MFIEPTSGRCALRQGVCRKNLLCESLWPPRLCGEAHVVRNQRRDAECAEVRGGFPDSFPSGGQCVLDELNAADHHQQHMALLTEGVSHAILAL